MSELCFLLDTNCFIESSKTYYPFCYAPAFWDALIYGHRMEMIYTLSEVKKEILEKGDEIRDWIEQANVPATFVQNMTDAGIQNYADMQKWVSRHPHFSPSEKSEFAEKRTDGYLVAHAKATNMVVVTQEKLIIDPNTTKIKIPNLCQQFGVKYTNLFDMLKQLNVRFILETAKKA